MAMTAGRWMLVVAGLMVVPAGAQTGSVEAPNPATVPKPAVVTTPEVFNLEALAAQGREMLAKAAAGSGSAGKTISTWKGSYMTLNARTKSGGGEFHSEWNDILLVLDGEGTELTGGTMVDGKEAPGGEIRGARLEGATVHLLHKGDFIHIPAGTNHQQIVGPGQTLVVLAIKIGVGADESAAWMQLMAAPRAVQTAVR